MRSRFRIISAIGKREASWLESAPLPAKRKALMSYNQLTENERYQIYILKKAGHSQVDIAEKLDRRPSTISRELRRKKGLKGYRPGQAQKLTDVRRNEACKARKVTNEVRNQIETLIRQELSPQQVAAYLKRHKIVLLHHETIYQGVCRDKANGGDLYTHLRVASKPYRKRYGSGKIKNRVSIDERPAVVVRGNRWPVTKRIIYGAAS